MKVFKIESALNLQPEDLVKLLLGAAGGILPGETETETEWKLIQSEPGDAEGEDEDAEVNEDPLDSLGGRSSKTLDLAVVAAPEICTGNCDGAGSVVINELITLINIALGTLAPSACAQGIPAGASVDISMLIRAVGNALNGCASA